MPRPSYNLEVIGGPVLTEEMAESQAEFLEPQKQPLSEPINASLRDT